MNIVQAEENLKKITAKLSKEKVELWLFALTLNTSRDKVKEEII